VVHSSKKRDFEFLDVVRCHVLFQGLGKTMIKVGMCSRGEWFREGKSGVVYLLHFDCVY
jgi:hypothetical protein